MVKEVQYTNIKRVLDNLTDHPLLSDVSLEQVIRYTLRFIEIHGFSTLYQDKVGDVEVEDFRGILPCDLISIVQIRDKKSHICLRSMTDSFPKGLTPHPKHSKPHKDLLNNVEHPERKNWPLPHHPGMWYMPPIPYYHEEPAFKTQGRVLYTTIPCGIMEVAYKAIPVDEDGYPLLIDNEVYLDALEAYIKKRVFTTKFDTGKIAANVLQNAQADYAWAAGRLNSEFLIPSVSEMESISRMMTSMLKSPRQFDKGFKDLGNREYIRKH